MDANQLIERLFVKAQQSMDEESCEAISLYVAMIRALYTIHQQNHWEVNGHGLHLLLQRLYEETQEMADEAGERAVGLCGELKHKGLEFKLAEKFKVDGTDSKEIIRASLEAERHFQDIAKKTYDFLKKSNTITLGLDDMIMGHASTGETHMFLLQKALEEPDFDVSEIGKEASDKCVGTKKAPVGSPKQKSFCDRMCGHKKKNTKSKTKKDPDSCINKALRRWKCRCD
jgi:DNA-binding ferritin-like protein